MPRQESQHGRSAETTEGEPYYAVGQVAKRPKVSPRRRCSPLQMNCSISSTFPSIDGRLQGHLALAHVQDAFAGCSGGCRRSTTGNSPLTSASGNIRPRPHPTPAGNEPSRADGASLAPWSSSTRMVRKVTKSAGAGEEQRKAGLARRLWMIIAIGGDIRSGTVNPIHDKQPLRARHCPPCGDETRHLPVAPCRCFADGIAAVSATAMCDAPLLGAVPSGPRRTAVTDAPLTLLVIRRRRVATTNGLGR
jgi:hypothetical protein